MLCPRIPLHMSSSVYWFNLRQSFHCTPLNEICVHICLFYWTTISAHINICRNVYKLRCLLLVTWFCSCVTIILTIDSWSCVRSSSFYKKKMRTFVFDDMKCWGQLDWSICCHIVIPITQAPTVQSIWLSGISQYSQF